MLASSDTSLTGAAEFFADRQIEAAFIVPTATGLTKSIMDAHESLREWLKRSGLHDFAGQPQGDKVLLEGVVISAAGARRTKVSLYRPKTKQGDPRIWVHGLNTEEVAAGNLLALVKAGQRGVAVINMSDQSLLATADVKGSPLADALELAAGTRLGVARELLAKLDRISQMGYVRSLRRGDTGVGYTLETLLGIAANSSKAPDYKGIELKASRRRPQSRATRVNLFSKTPDWRRSRVRSGKELLVEYGYLASTGRRELYCTVSPTPNGQGLKFQVGDNDVESVYVGPDNLARPVNVWGLADLQQALLDKHGSTFWVVADVQRQGEHEYFHYREVVHSQEPLASNIGPMVAAGKVTMDYTLSEKPSGLARDHGYLFKIWPRDRHLLIPSERTYQLAP